MKKRIGVILDQPFPTEDRTIKGIHSLMEAGFECFLLCLTFTDEPLEEMHKGFKITRLPYNKKAYNKFSATHLILPFHTWKWQKIIDRFIKENEIEILHLHDLPLSNIALKMKKKYGVKLVGDQHEYYSNWIGHTAHYNTFVGKIVRVLSPWKSYEQKMLSQFDLIMTIEEPLRQSYITDVKLSPEKVIAIPNTPLKSVFNEKNVKQEIIDRYKNDFVILYAGVVDVLRGLDIVVKSLPELKKYIPNIKFVIAGRLAFGCDPIKDAEKLGVREHVEFVGYVDSLTELPSYIAAANICNHTPYTSSEEVNKTIATKIYQYILMKKPIIVSQAKMMKEIVERNKVGYAIDGDSTESYISAVLKIFNKEEFVSNIPANCKKISAKYYWEKTIEPLIEKYKDL